jgi:hypothetical protein
MLLMHATKADWQAFAALPRAALDAHVAFLEDLDRQLCGSGELVSEGGLSGPESAFLVRAGCAGEKVSAAFPPDKEFLVGYWVVDCDTPGRARQIAASLSSCPGPAPWAVEVRPVMRPGAPEI